MTRLQALNRDEPLLTDLHRHLETTVNCLGEASREVKHMVADGPSVVQDRRRVKTTPRAAAGLTGSASMPRRLLAVVDGSESSRRVLDYVIGYAASIGPVEAVVLNVRTYSNGDPNAPLGITDLPSLESTSKRTIKSATRRLHRLGIVHKFRVEAGDPGPTIVRCSHEERCDMIILNDCQTERILDEPPQARNGREESVSEEVSKLTSVPVVIAR